MRRLYSPNVLFPSLAHQFLRTLGVSASHPAIRKYLVDCEADDPESIVEYMQKYFPRERHYYVILDALDELDIQSAQCVLQSLQALQADFQLHICCSTRHDSPVRSMVLRLLPNTSQISMSSVSKDEEIEAYINAELGRRCPAQKLDEEQRYLVRDVLVAGPQGMYLWVVLQVDALSLYMRRR